EAAQDVSTLQKRGRRRLVGAIALVLLAVIILPMVFDPEPRPNTPLVSVRIPGEDSSKFTPKVAPKPAKPPEPAAAPVPAPVEAAKSVPEPAKAPDKPAAKPAAKPVEKAAKVAEKALEKPAEKAVEKPGAAPAGGEQFMVQVGAFASPEKVQEITGQLKEAKLAHYTETVATAKGQVTRVRLGPFASKDAAEKARERAKALGLNPANPVAK
ncbi:unnamed protein product, partial [Phaeothamnion confervicola]